MARPNRTLRPFRGRLTVILNDLDPNSREYRAALFRIGTLVRNRAVANITRVGAVDEGFLRASISFKIEGNQNIQRVVIGAFGVKYARMVEYGGAFTDQMRKAMFASLRRQGKTTDRRVKRGSKVIVGNWYRGRPFLGPALRTEGPQIRGILRSLIKG